ncbi:hypothetical protein Fot_25189 [Forsythia ovata]|uniref:Uncharacterized protein n=1 Tax=Forsythia ovata TaxID=205694 RepID=A0ABD1U8C0_9LAMI
MEVLPNIHEEGYCCPRGPTSIYQILPRYLRSYPTPKREVIPNLGLISIYQVLPRYLKFYPTPRGRSYLILTKRDTIVQEVIPQYIRSYPTLQERGLPNLYKEGHYRPGGPTAIYQVLPISCPIPSQEEGPT